MGLGAAIPFIKGLAPKPIDPADVDSAVAAYLEEHPEATCPIDDTAGEGDTDKVLSADKVTELVDTLSEAIENVQGEIEGILVEEEGALQVGPEESATLTNAVTISDIVALYGITKTSGSGVVPLVFESTGTDKYLSFKDDTLRLASGKKWLVGFNSKAIKNNPSIGSPPYFRLAFGSNYFSYDSAYGQWVNYAEVYQGAISSVVLTHMNYPTTPGENEVSIEVKDYYAYDVTGLSENLINYIKEQQSTNFTDGTVTYTIGGGSGGFAPDTTLTEEGKVPDSKAVGDAIASAIDTAVETAKKPPLDKELQGVAFGTSLTQRAISNYGYLDYLPDLIGIEFDNQGVSSAEIKGSILTTIKGYTGYASKNVCIIEGFVNDWAHDKALGTWKDTTEDTSCGCLRSAINYILAQNPNITMFIVFDHYGRNNSGEDFSSTAQNTANLTPFEFYEEMAKVPRSLGIPVIKQYEESQISENTPQYLADYIHCNDLGAKQSAYTIFSKMKQYFQNQQSGS